MEPEAIALIMDALQFGAGAIAGGLLTEAGKEVFLDLKGAIRGKLIGQAQAEMVLQGYEEEPDVWVEPLKKVLSAADADQDEEIMEAARKLKKLEEAQQAATESSSMTISDHSAGARDDSAAATTGGVAVRGNVEGGINMGGKA